MEFGGWVIFTDIMPIPRIIWLHQLDQIFYKFQVTQPHEGVNGRTFFKIT
jgi:hypothetical protein